MINHVLLWLTKLVVRKHDIEICVLVGGKSSGLVKEILYTVLREKLNVRRNISEIRTKRSLPLMVLGYEDGKRSPVGWIGIFIKILTAIVRNKTNPHLLLINLSANKKEILDYWANLISPKYIVILDYSKKELLTDSLLNRVKDKGKVILDETYKGLLPTDLEKTQLFTYGGLSGDLILKRLKDGRLKLNYKSEELVLPKKLWPAVSNKISGSLFSVALLEGFSLREIAFASLKYSFPIDMISKVRNNIEKISVNV